ncbi:hypothetical protein CW304_19875 [Bacillus sp. UFRGS-B20]|nr:hypothetical protein CW304_19875 [Bacillus sp. UFRGS-B20]
MPSSSGSIHFASLNTFLLLNGTLFYVPRFWIHIFERINAFAQLKCNTLISKQFSNGLVHSPAFLLTFFIVCNIRSRHVILSVSPRPG